MYRLTHICIAIGFSLLVFEKTFSQVTFNTPTNSLLFTGQTLNLPVRVKNFNNIISVQFVISWDPTVLELENVFDLHLPDLEAQGNNFGYADAASGILRFSWYKDQPGGTTLADLDYIYYLRFTVIGQNGSGTSVSFIELPPITFFEVTKETGPAQFFGAVPQENGFQAVGYVVSTEDVLDEKAPKDAPAFDVFPNPFSEKLTVRSHSADFFGKCRLEVRNALGRLVFANDDFDIQPSAGTDIAKDQFENSGIYFLTFRTATGFFTQKAVFVEL